VTSGTRQATLHFNFKRRIKPERFPWTRSPIWTHHNLAIPPAPAMSRPLLFPTSFASSSRVLLPLFFSRTYATRPAPDTGTDSRTEIIRRSLYPTDSFSPKSASPTGSHHPQHLSRLCAVIHSPEVYETIERAWKLYQRQLRESKKSELNAKYHAMVEACDELDEMTKVGEEGEGGRYDRVVFDRAITKSNPYKVEKVTGRRQTPESRWLEARLDGLVPREAWVPTETRGKGWDYEWKRPSGERSVSGSFCLES